MKFKRIFPADSVGVLRVPQRQCGATRPGTENEQAVRTCMTIFSSGSYWLVQVISHVRDPSFIAFQSSGGGIARVVDWLRPGTSHTLSRWARSAMQTLTTFFNCRVLRIDFRGGAGGASSAVLVCFACALFIASMRRWSARPGPLRPLLRTLRILRPACISISR